MDSREMCFDDWMWMELGVGSRVVEDFIITDVEISG